MHEDISGVYEVERSGREGVATDVVTKRLHVRDIYPAEKSHLEVGSGDVPARANQTGQGGSWGVWFRLSILRFERVEVFS